MPGQGASSSCEPLVSPVRRAQPAHPPNTAAEVLSTPHSYAPSCCVQFHPSRRVLPIPGLGSLLGRTARRRKRRVGCSMKSSCELLRSLDAASGSVHRCELSALHSEKHQQGDVLRVCVSGGLRLTPLRSFARHISVGMVCMGRLAVALL
jgi:hypothetical protein